jgi:hypothetical protein
MYLRTYVHIIFVHTLGRRENFQPFIHLAIKLDALNFEPSARGRTKLYLDKPPPANGWSALIFAIMNCARSEIALRADLIGTSDDDL